MKEAIFPVLIVVSMIALLALDYFAGDCNPIDRFSIIHGMQDCRK